MTNVVDANKITAAATAVMQTLEDLSTEERTRVLQSVATLHGIVIPLSTGADGRGSESAQAEEGTDGSKRSKGKRQSLVEFLNEKQPATNSQRLATFAAYREQIEQKGSTFPKKELRGYFANAKLANPGGNYDRDFAKAVRAGWIHDDGPNSYLTQAGETAVAKGFSGKAAPRGSRSARKKVAADKAK